MARAGPRGGELCPCEEIEAAAGRVISAGICVASACACAGSADESTGTRSDNISTGDACVGCGGGVP